LLWGLNWPAMKFVVTDYPPWLFRIWTMVIGIAALAGYMRWVGASFTVARADWGRVLYLALLNGIVWHLLAVYAVRHLSSGRAAILGYTMPVWVIVLTVFLDKTRLTTRQWGGVCAAVVAIAALLWDELAVLTGKPFWLFVMLGCAALWALGTLETRRKSPPQVGTLTLTFWILVLSTAGLVVGTVAYEAPQWRWPSTAQWWVIVYSGLAAIAFAHVAYMHLARTLPSVVMSLAMMATPVVGVFSGVWLLGEQVRGADWIALVAVVLAMASVVRR
jgi:drug/metabolite transporter (DMT)-like permease